MKPKYVVYLASVGNPDFDQPFNLGIPARMVSVDSLEEASQVCLRFIKKYDLGGGNWIGGDVYDGESGQKIAHVSYNGMVAFLEESGRNDTLSDRIPSQDLTHSASTKISLPYCRNSSSR